MSEQGKRGSRLDASIPTPNPRHHPADILLMLLLIVGFFLGPIKLLGTSWFGYLIVDGLALVVLLLVFVERIATSKPLLVASPLSIPLLLLSAFCILELFNPEAPFIRSILGLRSWLLYLSFFFVGFYTLRSAEQVQRLYWVLLALGLLTAGYGVYQWQAGPQSFASWSDYYGRYAALGWSARSGGVVFRAFSTFTAAGTFAGNMALIMLLAFSVAVSRGIRVAWRIAAGGAFGVMAVGIAASGSRGPAAYLLLSAVIGLVLIPGLLPKLTAAFKTVVMGGVAVVLVVLVIGPVVSERFASVFDLQPSFQKWFGPLMYGVGIALKHPFGMGLGYTAGVPQFIPSSAFQGLPTTNVDSGYGSAAAELGLLGLALFTFFAFQVGVQGVRSWKSLPPGRLRDLLLGPAVLAATYPIVSVIGQPQATLPSSIYFWLLIGMLMKAPALQRQLDADQLLRSQVHARQ